MSGTFVSGVDAAVEAVREVLLREWDPHDVARRVELWGEAARGRYDRYVGELIGMVRGGAGDGEVAAYLREREEESMCFPGSGNGSGERLLRVARAVRSAVELS